MEKINHSAVTEPTRNLANGLSRVSYSARLWMLIGAVALITTAIILLVRYFPFSEKAVIESLRETFPSNITVDRFTTVYFPHPGCKAEGVKFRSSGARADAVPLATIQELTIQGNYLNLLARPHHISRVTLNRLRIYIPSLDNAGSFSGGYVDSKITIGEVVADGTVLEFARSGNQPPRRFDIHQLSLTSVSAKEGMSYHVAMRNAVPPGEIKSSGHFGPFQANDPGRTVLSGIFTFDGADLGVFDGIAGTVNSKGQFSGELGKVSVDGTTDSPNFEVTRSGHPARLATQFQLLVNGLNGDIGFQSVDATYFATKIHASGSVSDKQGWDGKFTSLDFSVHDGRIQDLLRIFVKAKRPPMSGVTNLQAHVTVPPEGKPFLQEVNMQGEFDIADGHFENAPRQESVDQLSLTARGMKKADDSKDGKDGKNDKDGKNGKNDKNEKEQTPAEDVSAHVHSHANVAGGIATFPDLMFVIPGADARMHGTYNLLNEKIDLHGTVKMDAKFSQSTTGIKAFFAKVLDPFLNKKHGSVVPVLADGTYSNPHFGLDLNPIKK